MLDALSDTVSDGLLDALPNLMLGALLDALPTALLDAMWIEHWMRCWKQSVLSRLGGCTPELHQGEKNMAH